MKILAERLLAIRKERKLTRKEVAGNLNIVERTYQRYEQGEREPTASILAELADFYGVSADYLLGRTDGKRCVRGASQICLGKD